MASTPSLGSTLDQNSKNDKSWTAHRRNADEVSAIYAASGSPRMLRYADRMAGCADWLKFAEIDVEGHDRKLKLASANFCRVRYCPVCAWRKTLALHARFQANLPKYIEAYPDYKYVHVVLTVRNPDMADLRAAIQSMNKAFAKLMKRKEVLAMWKGFVKRIEVKKGEDGNPHPHIHLTIAVNKSYFVSRDYIKQARWAQLWRESLQVDYDPVVYVAKVRKRHRKNGESNEHQELIDAMKETIKYSTKEEDLTADSEFLIGLTKATFQLHLFSTGGCFNGIFDKTPRQNVEGESDPEAVSDDELMLKSGSPDGSGIVQVYCWAYKDARKGNYYLVKRYQSKKQRE